MRRKHRKKRGSSAANAVASCIFAVLLSLLLAGLTVLAILWAVLCTDRGFFAAFDNEYYRMNLQYIEDNISYMTTSSGIDSSVFDGIFREEDLKKDVRAYIRAGFAGENYEPDLSEPSERLEAAVKRFLAEENVKFEGDQEAVITELVSDVMEIYRDGIELPGMGAISSARKTFSRYWWTAAAALAVFAFIAAALCVVSHRNRHRGLRYVAYAAGSTSLMCTVVPAALFFAGSYKHLGIRPEFIYHLVVSLVELLLKMLMIAGIGWLLMMFLLILVISAMRHNLMKRDK